VLDTNVIISSLLFTGSVPGKAFFEARRRGDLLFSAETVNELLDVLGRPKFDRYVLREERDRFLATLIRQATLVQPTERIEVCRDPKDNKWLELAVGGNADLIISGDVDLIALASIRGIPIVAPVQFLATLGV